MEDGPTFTVPVSHGSRLHFSWGLGSELRLLDVQDPNTQEGGEGGQATHVQWCVDCFAPSPPRLLPAELGRRGGRRTGDLCQGWA